MLYTVGFIIVALFQPLGVWQTAVGVNLLLLCLGIAIQYKRHDVGGKHEKNIGLLIVVLLVVAMVGTYVKQQIDEERAIDKSALGKDMEERNIGLANGDTPPDFTLTSLDGKDITLSDLRGKKVVLNFWATWCPPCKAEMPHMQSFYDEFAEEKMLKL